MPAKPLQNKGLAEECARKFVKGIIFWILIDVIIFIFYLILYVSVDVPSFWGPIMVFFFGPLAIMIIGYFSKISQFIPLKEGMKMIAKYFKNFFSNC